jgi:hypothetical protein
MVDALKKSLGTLALLLSITGCTSVSIEYDRMTGTAFPPAQTVAGQTVTIQSIYANAGYLVGVTEDETNIAALTGPASTTDPDQYDYITEAELDTLEQRHRGSPVAPTSSLCFNLGFFPSFCTTYYIYGIVVNHWFENSNGTRDQGIMGRMWATTNRRAFANFYKHSVVNTDGGRFLRSTAHEIGHAFNLHHEDGDGKTDIMNQTSLVGTSYVFTFVAAASTDHLSSHDANCRWPGMSQFGAVHTNHTNHGWSSATCP